MEQTDFSFVTFQDNLFARKKARIKAFNDFWIAFYGRDNGDCDLSDEPCPADPDIPPIPNTSCLM